MKKPLVIDGGVMALKVEPREPPEYCQCAETLVGGERVPKPLYHDCGWIAHRNAVAAKFKKLTRLTG